MTAAEEREAKNEADRRAALWEHRRWEAFGWALSNVIAEAMMATVTDLHVKQRVCAEAAEWAAVAVASFQPAVAFQPAPASVERGEGQP